MARGSILIVNDCTAVRAALDAIVRAQGYMVQTVKNGHDALAAMRAAAGTVAATVQRPGASGLLVATGDRSAPRERA